VVCFAINMLKHVDCVDGAGTSSFGMSGVNAHAIFTAAPIVERMQAASSVRYQRQRCWAVAAPHHLLGPAQPGRERCSFALDLLKPELSYLGDHQVGTTAPTPLTNQHTSFHITGISATVRQFMWQDNLVQDALSSIIRTGVQSFGHTRHLISPCWLA
jgi:hypothetical protein